MPFHTAPAPFSSFAPAVVASAGAAMHVYLNITSPNNLATLLTVRTLSPSLKAVPEEMTVQDLLI
ncbi:MAG: hypothetical protein CME98_00915 [Hyphomonas sp.]|nr:hypothetical protein [Hyphomonas sp.]